jgi:hypothetical protein
MIFLLQVILDPASSKSFWHERDMQLLLSNVSYEIDGEFFKLTPKPLHAQYLQHGACFECRILFGSESAVVHGLCIKHQVSLCASYLRSQLPERPARAICITVWMVLLAAHGL